MQINITIQKLVLVLAIATSTSASFTTAEEPERDGVWRVQRTPDGSMYSSELTVHPQAEPRPALKYRLMPDPNDVIEGNAALYYLKAMGFLEQTSAAARLQEFRNKYRKVAEEKGVSISSLPPYSWLEMAPQELPLAEVKEYLSNSAFQIPLLVEATRRTQFSLDRNIRDVESPVAYLLPEIQAMRELARTQSLRFKVALAEKRTLDALTIFQQQTAMARHLGSDEFVVSNLVGTAILSIAMQDAIYLAQQADAPNLYWALASLPKPVIGMERALPLERQFLFMQVKALKDVNETPRPAGYWQDFIDRVLLQIRDLELIDQQLVSTDPEVERAGFVSIVAAAYPNAKRYLMEECRLDRNLVDAYPTAQVVFLAMKYFSQQAIDEKFKWDALPLLQIREHPEFLRSDEQFDKLCQRAGWISLPVVQTMPAVLAIRNSQVRSQQQLALLQTTEDVRMYAASSGKLPMTLDALPYPAPNDPQTGQPFEYKVDGDVATLIGSPSTNPQYQLKLRLAK